ncbi:MAG TPA: serine/threonine-protein kinase [Myxococcaceae bacterium]|nr:serine/threonine-protein kinase [Myxococcaceae bacterium]
MAQTQGISRETVSGEALFILKNLKENGRLGRSNKLADVKALLEPSVSLEFDSYFFFLRKFHYIAMDREAQLKLTDQGERVVEGDYLDKFADEVGQFFSDQLSSDISSTQSMEEPDLSDFPVPGGGGAKPPPPPREEDLLIDSGPPIQLPAGSSRPGTSTRGKSASPPPAPSASVVVEDLLGGSPPQSTARGMDALDPKPPPSMPIVSPTPVPGSIPSISPMATTATASKSDADVRYVKFDPVGSGPLGTVFKGRHNALGLDVCLKELKDIFGYFSFLQRGEVIKRLKKELCAQAQVRHPAVVQVLDQNTDISRPFFVLELMKGSLREKLDQTGGKGLPVKNSLRIFLQLCYGMRAAHASGLNHHNIKPENVLFDALGNAKLSDFGLGRVIEVDQAKGMPQVFVGTGGMPYMSPELISRQKDVAQPADVYGLGILFYEMLTGGIPGRRSPLPSEVNPDVPSKLDPIFDKMTADRREGRYPDFEAVLADFYGAFSDGEMMTKGDLVLWS